MTSNTSAWLHGLFGALIGGGASAAASGIVLPMMSPGAYNFHSQLIPMLENMVAMFAVSGLLSAFLYLKQSPLPAETIEISKTTEQKTTVSTTPIDGPRP